MNEEANFCSQCGAKVNSGAKFCSSCGYDLQNSSAQTPLDKTIKDVKALIKSKTTPSPISIDELWDAPPKKSSSPEDSASYDSSFSESLPA
mgnify:CR=1 FL=1